MLLLMVYPCYSVIVNNITFISTMMKTCIIDSAHKLFMHNKILKKDHKLVWFAVPVIFFFFFFFEVKQAKLEDRLQNKVIFFAWQKQSVPKRKNNGSLIVSGGQKFLRNRSMSHCF